jgi:hypothetical protein
MGTAPFPTTSGALIEELDDQMAVSAVVVGELPPASAVQTKVPVPSMEET